MQEPVLVQYEISMKSALVSLSVVIPALNERERLPRTLETSLAYLRGSGPKTWEIIIVDDGSQDGTADFATNVMRKENRVRVLRSEQNLGKGAALAAGSKCARGDYLLFMDADGGTPLTALPELEACMRRSGSGLVVGTRNFGPRPWHRQLMGSVFRRLASTCVRGVQDTQCGFKLVTRRTARATMPYLRVSGWAYDVELLYLTQAQGLGVATAPVPSTDVPGSKIRWTTPMTMLASVVRVSLFYRIGLWRLPIEPRAAPDRLEWDSAAAASPLPSDEGRSRVEGDAIAPYVEVVTDT